MSKRGQSIALSVLAVVVAGIVVASYLNYQAKIEAAQGNPGTAFVSEPEPEPLALAFVGDSYTAGSGTSSTTLEESQAEGYAGLTAERLGATVTIDGQGGTGYLNPGQPEERETTYLSRARKVPGDPDVIVVQGGGNDLVMPGDLRPAVDRVLTTLHGDHPKAAMVVLGPVDAPGLEASSAEVAEVVATLQAAAKGAGATFIDARDWLPKRSLYIDDMLHPNPEGHAVMAGKLAQRIEQVG